MIQLVIPLFSVAGRAAAAASPPKPVQVPPIQPLTPTKAWFDAIDANPFHHGLLSARCVPHDIGGHLLSRIDTSRPGVATVAPATRRRDHPPAAHALLERGWRMGEVFSAALVGGLIGTFFGGFTKFLWEKWLPEWLTWRRTQRVERERQLAQVRAPAIRALSDLHGRLAAIARTQAANHRYVKKMGQGTYYIDSTAYLVARAFAWQEILRRRMASYDYAELYARLESLTEAFARGMPGFQVFRHEQTEIGERLIASVEDDSATCMSLSEFLDRIEQEDPPRWLAVLRKRVTVLLERPVDELCRTARIDRALIEILVFLDPQRRWRPAVASEAIDVTAILEDWRANGKITPERARALYAEAADGGLARRPAVAAGMDRDADAG